MFRRSYIMRRMFMLVFAALAASALLAAVAFGVAGRKAAFNYNAEESYTKGMNIAQVIDDVSDDLVIGILYRTVTLDVSYGLVVGILYSTVQIEVTDSGVAGILHCAVAADVTYRGVAGICDFLPECVCASNNQDQCKQDSRFHTIDTGSWVMWLSDDLSCHPSIGPWS